MKKFKYIGLLLFLFLQFNAHGQRHLTKEQLESKKIAYISLKLDLSPEEAQLFWPIYNQYEKEKKTLRQKRRFVEDFSNLTDLEAQGLIDKMIQLKEKEVEIQKVYIEKFSAVISPQKVFQLHLLENRFKEEMLRDIKRRLERDKN